MLKSPSEFAMQSPYVAIANKQAEIMMRIASEFAFFRSSSGLAGMLGAVSGLY
jgi:hypothetical protein